MTSKEKFDRAAKEVQVELFKKGLEWVYIACYGSDNYGLQTESSDMDIKVIVVPSLHSIVSAAKPISETWDFEWGQADIKDCRLMMENFLKQNTNFLEILFTDYYLINPTYEKEMEMLRDEADKIARIDECRHMRAILGMQDQKYHALRYPYPSKVGIIEKYGFDPKQLSHIIRLYDLMEKYVKGCSYKACITPYGSMASYIKSTKLGTGCKNADAAEVIARDYMKRTEELYIDYKDKAATCEEGKEVLEKFKYDVIKKALKEELK